MVLIGCGTLLLALLNFATDRSVSQQLLKLPQNTFKFLDPNKNLVMTQVTQDKLKQRYLEHYFFPWEDKITPHKLAEIKQAIVSNAKNFEHNPGLGANTHPHTQSWVKNLENNEDLAHFPNANQNTIIIVNANTRVLPTTEPSFSQSDSVSKGYPFDNLQESFITAGTPAHIIHISKDKNWYLILTSSYAGWIERKDVASVSPQFKKSWMTNEYAISTRDDLTLSDSKAKLAITSRVGVLYPITKISEQDIEILMPVKSMSENAAIQSLHVKKNTLTIFPLPLSTQNIARVTNNLIGKPYGWGGIYGYRDCSSTTQDIMASFAIWLPRNSATQAQNKWYTHFSLSNLNNSDKEKAIIKNGIPFLTLINMPGHVALYIGEKNGHPVILQNLWGVHVYKIFNNKDRVVIGRTVITPLNFTNHFSNASFSQLHGTSSMTNLVALNLMIRQNLHDANIP